MALSVIRLHASTTMKSVVLAMGILVAASGQAESLIRPSLAMSPAIRQAINASNRYFRAERPRTWIHEKRRKWRKAWIASIAVFAAVNVLDAHSTAGCRDAGLSVGGDAEAEGPELLQTLHGCEPGRDQRAWGRRSQELFVALPCRGAVCRAPTLHAGALGVK